MSFEDIKETARLCSVCPKMCRHVCTTGVLTRNESDSPTDRSQTATRFFEEIDELSESSAAPVYRCATCSLCNAWCETDNDVAPVLIELRRHFVDKGLAPKEARGLNETILKTGNIFGKPQEQGFEAVADAVNSLPKKADTLLFVGCNTRFNHPSVAQATVAILKDAGEKFTVLKEGEPCCGDPQHMLGFAKEARELAQRNAEAIKKTGAKRIVFVCGSCMKLFAREYAEWGIDLGGDVELTHISQETLRLLDEGKIQFKNSVEKKLAFHDSCNLGRRLEVFDEPREILRRIPGAELFELEFNRKRSNCCGAGGGIGLTNFDLSVKAGVPAVEQAGAAGADVLVTGCQTCKQSFDRHTPFGEGLEVLHITEIARQAM